MAEVSTCCIMHCGRIPFAVCRIASRSVKYDPLCCYMLDSSGPPSQIPWMILTKEPYKSCHCWFVAAYSTVTNKPAYFTANLYKQLLEAVSHQPPGDTGGISYSSAPHFIQPLQVHKFYRSKHHAQLHMNYWHMQYAARKTFCPQKLKGEGTFYICLNTT